MKRPGAFPRPKVPMLSREKWLEKVNFVLVMVKEDVPLFTEMRAKRAVEKIYGPCP